MSGAALYAGLVAAVLEDDVITPEEQQRLRAFCKKHFITAEQHANTLQSLGYTVELFDQKVAQVPRAVDPLGPTGDSTPGETDISSCLA